MKMNSINDFRNFISDQGVDEYFYVDDYVEIVAHNFHNYLRDERGFEWGNDLDDERFDISDEIFWSFFVDAEKDV